MVLLPGMLNAAEGGKVILNLKTDEYQGLSDLPEMIEDYKKDISEYDKRYPGAEIQEDFLDDLIAEYPDSPDEKNMFRQKVIRLGVKTTRFWKSLKNKAQEFFMNNDIPLVVEEEDYADSSPEIYIPSTDGKPIVIQDFKRTVGYSQTDKDKKIIINTPESQSTLKKRYEQIQEMRKAFLEKDYQKLLTYGIWEGSGLEDDRGGGLWVEAPSGLKSRIVSEKKSISTNKQLFLLQILIPQGHIILAEPYEQYPSGKIDFKLKNATLDNISYPIPYRFPIKEDESLVGYYDCVFIPFYLQITDPAQEVDIVADITAELCFQNKCFAEKMLPQLHLKAEKTTEDSRYAALVRLSRNASLQEKNQDIQVSKLVVDDTLATNHSPVLRLEINTPQAPADMDIFLSTEDKIQFKRPLISISPSKVTARFSPKENISVEELLQKDYTVALRLREDTSLRQKIKAVLSSEFDTNNGQFNLGILGLAFFGGLLLNLMPCVFPVLSLKLLSFAEYGGKNFKRIRQNFLFNAVGIFSSFALLSLMLVILKLSGYSLGWGMQFQSVSFLIVMSFVITIFFAQIMGWINIKLPSCLGKANSLSNVRTEGFLSGLFLVLLSTPCSAPYLGTALGFALGQGIKEIVWVMAFIALGLSFPYLIIALFPKLSVYIPAPGAWMSAINRLMQLLLGLTVVWLLSLIASQVGFSFVIVLCFTLLGILVIIAYRRLLMELINRRRYKQEIKQKLRQYINGIALLLISVALFFVLYAGNEKQKEQRLPQISSVMERLDPEVINNYLRANTKVLVRIGANWCLTCRYNDITVFNENFFKEYAMAHNIAVIDIDWSDYNPEVLEFMARYGRRGIPFYVLYSPRVPEGIVLPEIINEMDFREMIKNLDY